MRDTGAILPAMNPDRRMAENVRHAIEDLGDKVVDPHVWTVGASHISAVVSAATNELNARSSVSTDSRVIVCRSPHDPRAKRRIVLCRSVWRKQPRP
jgi:Co/Zn/Cd efflux system component